MSAAAFGATFAALYAAHQVADHWVQTQRQAETKGGPGWRSRLACAAHVATYTVVAAGALAAADRRAGLDLNGRRVVAGLTVSAVSHYVVDRRAPLRRAADALGKSPAWLDHGGGMYALDQSAHAGFLFLAALVISGRTQ